MILTAHQPAYLPWLGYFSKIKQADVFIFLDSVQFEKNSFINRNKIQTHQGPIWLSIPVITKDYKNKSIAELEIDPRQKWASKHLKSIAQNYKKAPHFDRLFPQVEALYQEEHPLLGDLCLAHLKFWLKELQIDTQLVRSSTLDIESKKSDLVLDLCRHFEADHYISGALGKDYLEEENFAEHKIGITYQDYSHPEYPQLHGEFQPYLSVLDFLMSTDQVDLIDPK